ncbi:MAG: isoprenyl transferase [Holosporales bacterium]
MSTELATPQHVAIIMDGNGRWAKSKGLPRLEGHRRGVGALERAVQACVDLEIKHLTVYAFSTENWRRPMTEVQGIMHLLTLSLEKNLKKLHQQGVRIRIFGTLTEKVPDSISRAIQNAIDLTAQNTRLHLNIAFNYGGRDEIVRAARQLAEKVQKGDLSVQDITQEEFASHLFSAGQPDPDLLIRTSGLSRISNFLLWQLAYAEMVFLPIYWPDFDRVHLEEAIRIYQGIERKFGDVGPSFQRAS